MRFILGVNAVGVAWSCAAASASAAGARVKVDRPFRLTKKKTALC